MIIIGKTIIDWPTFLTYSKGLLGQSITTIIDRNKLPLDSPLAYFCALYEFSLDSSTENIPYEQLKILQEIFLSQFEYSFLFRADNDLIIQLFWTKVCENILTGYTNDLFILKISLLDIIKLLGLKSSNYKLQAFSKKLYELMCKEGLQLLLPKL